MFLAIKERDQAILILDSNLVELSKLYKKSYLSKGRLPSEFDYDTKEEILEVFYDDPPSKAKLKRMIDKYDVKNEGIMMLITSYSNATYFITVKLKWVG